MLVGHIWLLVAKGLNSNIAFKFKCIKPNINSARLQHLLRQVDTNATYSKYPRHQTGIPRDGRELACVCPFFFQKISASITCFFWT